MNLRHLKYFWAVGHARSVARAAKLFHLTPQTISSQVKLLEEDLGTNLLRPAGRGVELTEAGQVALAYADQIFSLGDELTTALRTHAGQGLPIFRVGMSDVVPKSLALRLLTPLAASEEPVRVICRVGRFDWLLGELALHRLDMVVADRPMPPRLAVRAYNHKLGESPMAFFTPSSSLQGKRPFPACLVGAPLVLPGPNTAVRGEIDSWIGEARLVPKVMGEFDDSGLMKAFAQANGYCFPAPAVLSREIVTRYAARELGRVASVREAFWLIGTERRVSHPVTRAVLDAARSGLFEITPGNSMDVGTD